MKEERYAELVNKSKTNSEAMLKLIITMTPLIRKYSKKLFFMEYEDAEQEMVLALIKAVKKYQNVKRMVSVLTICKMQLNITFQIYVKKICNGKNAKKYAVKIMLYPILKGIRM